MEFKVGDKLRRKEEYLNSGDWKMDCDYKKLNYQGIFTIESIDLPKCHLVELSGKWDLERFNLTKKGKVVKPIPVDRHIVMEDDCNNSHGVYNSYENAVDRAKDLSGKMTIYRMVEVATVQSERKVVRVRPEKKVKARKK